MNSTNLKAFHILLVICCLLTIHSLISLNRTFANDEKKLDSHSSSGVTTYTIQQNTELPLVPLPPISWNSSWLGNQWIPSPDYRVYSPQEIKKYFSNHSVLVMGDSTARRQFATWYAVMNAKSMMDQTVHELDHTSIIDINKLNKKEKAIGGYDLSRRLPSSNKSWYYQKVTCVEYLVEITLHPTSYIFEKLGEFSLVIFIMGPWEYTGMHECLTRSRDLKTFTEIFMERLTEMVDAYPNTKFIWRTWASTDEQSWKHAQAYNHFIKSLIQQYQMKRYESNSPSWSHISYVDWGHVMGPRSFPREKRIQGDTPHHYGLEARSCFIQMLINHLKELEREEFHNLPPGWTLLKSNDTADDCVHAGGSERYCLNPSQLQMAFDSFMTVTQSTIELSPEEAEEYELAKSHFCSNCTWQDKFRCGERLLFLQGQYKLSLRKAMTGLLRDFPQCDNTKGQAKNVTSSQPVSL